MLLHSVDTLTTVATSHHVVEAGVLKAIRNAVIAVLVVAFLFGGFLGFLVGRAYGRRFRG